MHNNKCFKILFILYKIGAHLCPVIVIQIWKLINNKPASQSCAVTKTEQFWLPGLWTIKLGRQNGRLLRW